MPSLFQIAVFLVSWLYSVAWASDTPRASTTAGLSIGPHLEYALEDEGAQLTLEEARGLSFAAVPRADANFGFQKRAIWFRLQLNRLPLTDAPYVLTLDYPLLDNVDFYVDSTDRVRLLETGDRRPFRNRDIDYRLINLELRSSDREATVYFRIESESSLQASGSLYPRRTLDDQRSRENLILGSYYGCLVVMTLYNLFIFFFLRSKIYLLYVAYQSFYLAFQSALNGTLFQYLLPDMPQLASSLLPFFMMLSAGFLALFTEKFLNFNYQSRFEKMMKWSRNISFFLVPLMFLVPYSLAVKLVVSVSCILPPLGLVVSVIKVKKRESGAVYYLLAFGLLLAGMFIYALKTVSILPHVFFTEYAIQIGSASEAILLSLGLAYQIDQMRTENQTLNVTLRNEVKEKTKLFEDLQAEVAERKELQTTALELQRSQERKVLDLKKISQDYEEAMLALHKAKEDRQLIQQELSFATEKLIQADKLATFGTLVAGVAHDIANPTGLIALSRERIEHLHGEIKQLVHSIFVHTDDPEAKAVFQHFTDRFRKIDLEIQDIALATRRIRDINQAICNQTRSDAQVTSFELEDLLRECLVILSHKLQDIQVQLVGASALLLMGRRSQMGQMLMNLLSNAADAIHEQQASSKQILISVLKAEYLVTITIEDSGPGIPVAIRSKILEPFFTTKPVGSGTGLGMPIVMKILSDHGGSLEIDDSPSLRGARITIKLPRASR